MNKSDKLKVQCREFDQPVFIEIKERVIKVEETEPAQWVRDQ
jgi:hypothetical protein